MTEEVRECAECRKGKPIPENDFLCRECREAIPIECRLVADIDDSPVIVTLTGTKQYIKLRADIRSDTDQMVIRREDLPQVAIEALRNFIQ